MTDERKTQNEERVYWGSAEEWKRAELRAERATAEFLNPPLQEDLLPMERRDFLKVMGAGMALAAIGCSRRPVEKIMPYVNKPEEITPGVASWYATTCSECSAACGMLAKVREGRPIKLEGNNLHPLNRGSLCARGEASILNLYDPDRVKHPASIEPGTGTMTERSWSEIDAVVKAKLTEIKTAGGTVAILTGALTSPSTTALINDFLKQFPSGKHVAYEAVVPEEVGLGQERSFGQRVTPRYRFDQARLIVTFGADILGTWLSPVEFAKGFSASRRVDHGRMSRLVCFEPTISLTGTNADEYVPIKAGEEIFVALALAHELMVRRGLSAYAGRAEITSRLAPYSVETVAAQTGIDAALIRRMAHELWQERGQGIVVGGTIKAKYSTELQSVVNLLNAALENDGATIDATLAPSLQATSSFADVMQLVADMKAGKIAALLLYKTDPIAMLPLTLGFTKALTHVPLVVSCTTRLNATALVSHFLAPDVHFLEAWNDASPQAGLMSLTQPTIAPLFNNRSFQDSLIAWGASAQSSWHDDLKARWEREVYPRAGTIIPFERFWEMALEKGVVDLVGEKRTAPGRITAARPFRAAALADLPPLAAPSAELALALYPSVSLYDGRAINNPWLRELPDPISKITWENVLSVAPQLAAQRGLEEGDVVSLTTAGFSAELPIHIQPKLHAQSVAVAIGYGASAPISRLEPRGVDVTPFQTFAVLPAWTGEGVSLAKTGRRMELACVQGHQDVAGRPIIAETTWKNFQVDPSSGIEAEHRSSLWTAREYKGHRWGMAIDLNACIGCSACIVACQAENNIPSVGKFQVTKGREMHWLRIDRYYSGPVENPDVVHQPMLCQQCENAPCETVCPTLATFHSDDGLNQMTYNRCVGTRYCSNNCPYKVRRFNFLNFVKDVPEPRELAFNPDVTVRSRGVMEKCTFCIQRIRAATDTATITGKALQDGDITTACQQSCPAEAIVFGDLNDPESRVAKLTEAKRGYHVLAELNTRPAVTYLSKVRAT